MYIAINETKYQIIYKPHPEESKTRPAPRYLLFPPLFLSGWMDGWMDRLNGLLNSNLEGGREGNCRGNVEYTRMPIIVTCQICQ